MKKISQEELNQILEKHEIYMTTLGQEGERAELRGVDLRGVDLRGADLRGIDLRGADLEGAYLEGAILENAKFGIRN